VGEDLLLAPGLNQLLFTKRSLITCSNRVGNVLLDKFFVVSSLFVSFHSLLLYASFALGSLACSTS
jgi:hypothetical protein